MLEPNPDSLEVMANDGVLTRIDTRDQFLENRLNVAIGLSASLTVALFGIMGYAKTHEMATLAAYMPAIGMFSVYLAWRFSDNLKSLTQRNLDEGRLCEAKLAEKVTLYVRSFRDRDDAVAPAWSLDRMKAILAVIAFIWACIYVLNPVA